MIRWCSFGWVVDGVEYVCCSEAGHDPATTHTYPDGTPYVESGD
ncbi:hypothetical protein SEA_FEDE_13 [Microbacterium phage Fede]|nr:hypothetical protein SEA_FEDE_13 [Microbacterium phage Fede]